MAAPGPGIRWLAARTGEDPDELVRWPAHLLTALRDATREVASLAARSASADEEVRADARAEAEELSRELASGPSAGEVLGRRTAAALREAAQRLRDDASGRR